MTPVPAALGLMGALLYAQTSTPAKLLHEAETRIEAEQFGVAEGLLQRAIRQAPADTDGLYRLAYVQYRKRKLAPARLNFAAVVKLARSSPACPGSSIC